MSQSNQDFINWIAPFAMETMRESQILASLTMAQACLESGYGQSELTKEANNFFGIKGSGDAGSVSMPTTEYVNGQAVTVQASFAKYSSPKQCFDRRANLFLNGVSWDANKYRNLIGETDILRACRLVQLDGYATDPEYASKLISIVSTYNLTSYDNVVLHEKSIPADSLKAYQDLVSWGLIAPNTYPDPNAPMIQGDVWKFIHQAIGHIQSSTPAPAPAPAPVTHVYIVQAGDSLSKIIGTSDPAKIAEIAKENGIPNPDKIFVGEKVVLDGSAAPAPAVHIVKAGESISEIIGSSDPAKIKAVCDKNGIKNQDMIYVGQKITL